MLELRKRVCAANRAIGELGLSPLTWGNASEVDRELGVVAIKPSGVDYEQLQPGHIVVVSLEDGDLVSGGLAPSTDVVTHLELYRRFPSIGGIVHTHSRAATIWAQACRPIPCLGTTHADHFRGEVPVTRELSEPETGADYAANTGRVIGDAVEDPEAIPGVLVAHHAPFVWGPDAEAALMNAVALEHIADMALATIALNPSAAMPEALAARHFERKHGPGATYGQG